MVLVKLVFGRVDAIPRILVRYASDGRAISTSAIAKIELYFFIAKSSRSKKDAMDILIVPRRDIFAGRYFRSSKCSRLRYMSKCSGTIHLCCPANNQLCDADLNASQLQADSSVYRLHRFAPLAPPTQHLECLVRLGSCSYTRTRLRSCLRVPYGPASSTNDLSLSMLRTCRNRLVQNV
jgi:hypothetical protein